MQSSTYAFLFWLGVLCQVGVPRLLVRLISPPDPLAFNVWRAGKQIVVSWMRLLPARPYKFLPVRRLFAAATARISCKDSLNYAILIWSIIRSGHQTQDWNKVFIVAEQGCLPAVKAVFKCRTKIEEAPSVAVKYYVPPLMVDALVNFSWQGGYTVEGFSSIINGTNVELILEQDFKGWCHLSLAIQGWSLELK